MKRTNAHEPAKFAKNSFLNSLINARAEEIVNDVFETQLSLKGIQYCPTTRAFYHLFAPDNVLVGHGELMAMLISCGWDPEASNTSVDERVVEKCYVNLLTNEKFKAWRVAFNASSFTVDEISSGNSNTRRSSTTPPPSLPPRKTPSLSKSLSPQNGVESDDNDIPMIEEEYQKGKSVAKQRGGAATQKSLEYKPTCEYPKELLFIEPKNRVGTRVSYRGRKGSVTGKGKTKGYYIVTFDDDGNNTRNCGYGPSELLVLDSNDNEIPMTEEEYQKGKLFARQRRRAATRILPEYEPTCEYPKELLFIEPKNRVGTRASFRGRKGNVTGKVKDNSNYIVTFDDDGNNTRNCGYPPRELLVLDSNDNEIPMTEEEYQGYILIHTTLDPNICERIYPPKLSVKNNGEPDIPYQIKIYLYCAIKVAEQAARERKIEWVVVVTLVKVSRFFESNKTYDAVFSTEGTNRLGSTRPQQRKLAEYDGVQKANAFLQEESNNKKILEGMVKVMKGLVTEDMLTKNRGFYSIGGSLKEAVNALRYEELENVPEIEDKTCKVVKSGAIFSLDNITKKQKEQRKQKGGETRVLADHISSVRYPSPRGVENGVEKKCQDFRVATINASAGFAYFVEGTVHMIIEKNLNEKYKKSDGTRMVGEHREALMVKTGIGDEEFHKEQGDFWEIALKEAVGKGFNYQYEHVSNDGGPVAIPKATCDETFPL